MTKEDKFKKLFLIFVFIEVCGKSYAKMFDEISSGRVVEWNGYSFDKHIPEENMDFIFKWASLNRVKCSDWIMAGEKAYGRMPITTKEGVPMLIIRKGANR